MEQYLNQFLDSLATDKGYSANTVSAYLNDLTQFVEYLRNQTSRSTLEPTLCTAPIVNAYVVDMESRQYASATIARKLAAIKSFFHYLQAQNVVLMDPTIGLDIPRIAKRLPHALAQNEIERLLAAPGHSVGPKALRDKAILELLYATGLRVTELVMLQVDDLDLENSLVICRGKNDRQRSIPIQSETTVNALKDYLLRARPGLAKESEQTALFLNHRGEKLTRQGLWLIIKACAELANITAEVTPHTLRHSFAKHLLDNGAEIRQLQELLGHANLSTTLVYEQPDNDQ